MADTETIETTSTPAETVEDTSNVVEPAPADTSTTEPETQTDAAEENGQGTETKKLFADKYENVEELEKGYKELQGSFSKAKEWETKYNDLLKTQKEAEEQKQREQLFKAQQQGYNTIEEFEVKNTVQKAELEALYANIGFVDESARLDVERAIKLAHSTGDMSDLKAIKSYYPTDFIERLAEAKFQYSQQLKEQASEKHKEALKQSEEKLGNAIKEQFSDFLSDIQENEGKAIALKLFCNSGNINSLEDMQVFVDTFNKVAQLAGERAIKEFEARKAIEETKNKAVIPTDSQPQGAKDTEMPTADELRKNPKLYSKAVKKWGMDTVDSIIMKG